MPQQVSNPVYDTWDAWRTRVSSPGVVMMPTTGRPPSPCIPVMLNGGMEYEELVFVAGRWGKMPIIPKPYTLNQNRIFLGGGQGAGFPLEDQGGYKMYRVVGVYYWGILNPEGLECEFMLGAGPFPGFTADTEYLPNDYQDQNLINQRSAPTLSGPMTFRQINQEW